MRKKWRPYLTAFRLRAMQETQYRAAALGGLVTQAFFGLVYIFLYTALIGADDPALLRETITYVWLQQMFLRTVMGSDGELSQLILSGGLAYAVIRPVDQQLFWYMRDLAMRVVGCLMRAAPMALLMLLLPASLRMSLPDGLASAAQFAVSITLGILCACAIGSIAHAINMRTLDNRGLSAMLNLILVTFSGNVVPLTLFPEHLQTLIRYQPFAQALDLPIRLWQNAMPLGEWALNVGIQAAWLIALIALARVMWRRNLNDLVIQGG